MCHYELGLDDMLFFDSCYLFFFPFYCDSERWKESNIPTVANARELMIVFY
jgi:hypothetical protein